MSSSALRRVAEKSVPELVAGADAVAGGDAEAGVGRFFERAEFEDVRAALPEHLRGVVTLGFLTGWRIASELLPLQWSQVDRREQVIRLEPGTTKNGEGRTLPYGRLPELVEVVETAWRAHLRLAREGRFCPFVFHHRGGQRIGSFRKAWARACREAGVPGRLLHDLRRTAVRNLERAEVPEKIAMGVSGHKTRSVFDRTDIASGTELRDALANLDSSGCDSVTGKEKGKTASTGRVVDAASR